MTPNQSAITALLCLIEQVLSRVAQEGREQKPEYWQPVKGLNRFEVDEKAMSLS